MAERFSQRDEAFSILLGDADLPPMMERLARDSEVIADRAGRSEEHTSALQSLMRNSYAVFCSNKNTRRAYSSSSVESTWLTQTDRKSTHQKASPYSASQNTSYTLKKNPT